MISFTVFVFAIDSFTHLQFVVCIGFILVVSFVLVAQSFTDTGFNLQARKNFVIAFILHDGGSTRVSIKWNAFRLFTIRTLSVPSTWNLQR